MNPTLRFGTALLLLLQLGGCANIIVALREDVLAEVQRYETEQEYGKALALIAAVPRDHAQYSRVVQKKPAIEAKAKAFEQASIGRANELVAQNRWGDALDLYRDALDKLPRSEALRADLKVFRRRQEQRVQELEVEQLVARARWLERSLPVQESIARTDPESNTARQQLEAMRDDAANVSKRLSRIGLSAMAKNNLALAGRTLPIASRLSPNPETERARDLLSDQEAARDNATLIVQNQSMDRMRNEESRKLLGEFQQAFGAGDLRRSRLIMARLQDLDARNPEVVQAAARLRTRLDAAVKNHMDEGSSLYGRGKFEEAVARWNLVLELDPDNELARASLDRAARVVDKLRQLRGKQAPEPQSAGL